MAEFGFVMSPMMPLGCRGGKNRLANSFEICATGRDSPTACRREGLFATELIAASFCWEKGDTTRIV